MIFIRQYADDRTRIHAVEPAAYKDEMGLPIPDAAARIAWIERETFSKDAARHFKKVFPHTKRGPDPAMAAERDAFVAEMRREAIARAGGVSVTIMKMKPIKREGAGV